MMKVRYANTRRITTWFCASCDKPYARRVPHNEELRLTAREYRRVGVCPTCRVILRERVAEREQR